MGRDGEDARLFIFLFMSCQVWDLELQRWCWTPVLMSPILPNTAETYLGPQLGVVPQEPGMEWAPGHSLRA